MKAILFPLMLMFLQAPDEVRGLVVGPDGVAISGATVRARLEGTDETGLSITTRTDSSGQYRIGGVASGNYIITAEINGQKTESSRALLVTTFETTLFQTRTDNTQDRFQSRTVVQPIALGPARVTVPGQNSEVTIVISKGGATVSGRMSVLPASPLPDPLRVTLTNDTARISAEFVVQSDGTFALINFPPGDYLLRLVPNMGISPKPITVSDQNLSDVKLGDESDGLRVSGRIPEYEHFRNPMGTPIFAYLIGENGSLVQSSKSVILTAITSTPSGLPKTISVPQMVGMNDFGEQFDLPITEIGSEGQFEFLTVPPGAYYLRTTPDIGMPNTVISVKDVNVSNLHAGAGVRVRGEVVPTNLGTRPPDTIRLTEVGSNGPAVSTVINEYGAFEFPSVGPATYRVLLDGKVRPKPSEITVDETDTIIRVESPFSSWIRGRVLFAGANPPPETVATIHVAMNNGYETVVSPDGSFRLPSNDGEYDFFAKDLPDGYVVKSAIYGSDSLVDAPVKVDASAPSREITLTLERRPGANLNER